MQAQKRVMRVIAYESRILFRVLVPFVAHEKKERKNWNEVLSTIVERQKHNAIF